MRLSSGLVLFLTISGVFAAAPKPGYPAVAAVFNKHCLDCHSRQEADAGLVLETFAEMMKGGETGAVIQPGKSADSLLVKFLEGHSGRKGKYQFMPPGNRKHLAPDEIATIKSWIDAGATAPAPGQENDRLAKLPRIPVKGAPKNPINALAFAPKQNLVAIGRHGSIELRDGTTQSLVRTLPNLRGQVNALSFSTDGTTLFAAAGEPGISGEVRQFRVVDGTLIRAFDGHRDAICSLALSPNGASIATGSYDQKIILWNVADGTPRITLSGHNGAVFALDFRPDGKLLASASADRTVKLWDVTTGDRRDTLAQSLKELHTLAFTPDGKRLFAGGVDNRIRIWSVSEKAAETTNPLIESRFAHEGSILKLAFSKEGRRLITSATDRTVKIWDTEGLKEVHLLTAQPDWSSALVFLQDDDHFAIGRLDGSFEFGTSNRTRKDN
ncbi:MAG: hypothetical protein EXS24_02640 [Pedosphaera sp.]|nr:hypothetical protein [Pedosphaera sp.]